MWTSAGGQLVSELPVLDTVRGRIGRMEEEKEKGKLPVSRIENRPNYDDSIAKRSKIESPVYFIL